MKLTVIEESAGFRSAVEPDGSDEAGRLDPGSPDVPGTNALDEESVNPEFPPENILYLWCKCITEQLRIK
jgi:hypothetical protein